MNQDGEWGSADLREKLKKKREKTLSMRMRESTHSKNEKGQDFIFPKHHEAEDQNRYDWQSHGKKEGTAGRRRGGRGQRGRDHLPIEVGTERGR